MILRYDFENAFNECNIDLEYCTHADLTSKLTLIKDDADAINKIYDWIPIIILIECLKML